MFLENFTDSAGLGNIVCASPGAMSIDIADLLRRDAAIPQCLAHRLNWAGYRGFGDVTGIGRHAEPGYLGVDARAAGLRGLPGLEHQHGSSFAQHHATAIFREWTAGILRDDAQRLPCLQYPQTERRLAAAGDGQLRLTVAHHVEGL